MAIKVLVHGFGVIGKRVAWGVTLQNDMKLVGIANRSINFNVRNMIGKHSPLKGTDIYASNKENLKDMENSEFKIKGTLEDILASKGIDVLVDATPEKIEVNYKPLYEKYGVKTIYQGGAEASIAPISFNADVNYEKAVNQKAVRVVSCNTTSLIRTIHALDVNFGVEEILATLVRRAVDPSEDKKGPINSIEPVVKVPSHHGPDVKTVLPHINISTMAVKVPVTMAHVHCVVGKLKKTVQIKDVVDVFRKTNRVLLFKESDGYTSSSVILEYFRDINRPRSDVYEVPIWEDSIKADDNKVYWVHTVHSEGIVLPENIDAIRAITGAESKEKSIEKTNKTLGVLSG
jgi:glyceraldehyde-3-phosphate dehydrogenase (NAD(P))